MNVWMAVATYDQVRAYAGPSGPGMIKLAQDRTLKNLFLSHSQKDESLLPGAIGVLQQHGASVYVDVADAGLAPGDPSAAARLRAAVQSCKRVVVLTTENTSTSRWIPWEMGLADGSAGPTQVAVLPMRASTAASDLWAKQEYFDLYARIEAVASTGGTSSWVVRVTPSGQYVPLADWLRTTRR